jgi:hypothetical protein
MGIPYCPVLANLAALCCHPEALPSHFDFAEGVVQVSDETAFGTVGGFANSRVASTTNWFGIPQFGPAGSRHMTEQWGTDAIADPLRRAGLQDLYRVALAVVPLPPPNAVASLQVEEPGIDLHRVSVSVRHPEIMPRLRARSALHPP